MMTRWILILFICLSLSGCGFHLRGHGPLPPQLRVLHLQTNNPYTAFSKQLRQALCSTGIQLVDNPSAAPVTLQILGDNFGQAVTSIGSSQQVTTYALSYTISYQINDANGHTIIGPQTIIANRSYQIASNQILADTSTLFSLQDDMRRDVIFQLLNRLRARCTLQALSQVC